MPIPAGPDTLSWEPDYITVDDLKAYVKIDDNLDDDELALVITATSRAIDRHCNRQFGQVLEAETRYYTAVYDRRLCGFYIEIDDLMTTNDFALQVESNGNAITSYKFHPRNAAVKGMPWTSLTVDRTSGVLPTTSADDIALTAIWGWSTVPSAVKFACRLQASRFLARRDSPYGIAGSLDTGSELRLLSKVDPDVGVSLRKYVRQVLPL